MKEKYIKLESVLTALYSNKRIGDNGDIDPKAITDVLALPTKEIETTQDLIDKNYNDWQDSLKELLKKPNLWQDTYFTTNTYIPEACRNCSNHPSNGGSGICHCILGTQVTY